MSLWLLTVLQIGVPLAILGWIAFGTPRSAAAWVLAAAGVSLCLVGERLVGLWLLAPPWAPLALLMLTAPVLTVHGGAARLRRWPVDAIGWAELAIASSVPVVGIVLIAVGVMGRQIPQGTTIDLAFPLRDGTYYVANAGSTPLLNAHLMTLDVARFA